MLVAKFLGMVKQNSFDIDSDSLDSDTNNKNIDNIDCHCCLRPVSGDDVPIIGQTRVSENFEKLCY